MASLLVAAAVSLGYALCGVPNIELMTITIFVSGFLLGVGFGGLIGGLSAALYSMFNPMGAALPPLLAAQIVGFAVVGVFGGLVGPGVGRMRSRRMAVVCAAVLGFTLTLFYDLITNVGAFFVITGTREATDFLKFVIAGIMFMGVHILWNTGLFAVVLKPMLNVLSRYRGELF
ncbi:MAG: hypothetical protein JSW58_02285 [Candidatus Latescibacterota bacterium]|nr:MAG: hypothetical protein JSW58_02285 [Candidatus Latescibacterota bacterium]